MQVAYKSRSRFKYLLRDYSSTSLLSVVIIAIKPYHSNAIIFVGMLGESRLPS